MADWSFDPGVVLTLLVTEGLYLRALRVLAGRGVRVGRFQIVLWHLGILLWVIGLLSPVDARAKDGLTFHMTQHLLIADLAAPLLIAGIRNPVLAFVVIRAFKGHFTTDEHRGVEVPGIYWHFVDIMWIVVYTTVYII